MTILSTWNKKKEPTDNIETKHLAFSAENKTTNSLFSLENDNIVSKGALCFWYYKWVFFLFHSTNKENPAKGSTWHEHEVEKKEGIFRFSSKLTIKCRFWDTLFWTKFLFINLNICSRKRFAFKNRYNRFFKGDLFVNNRKILTLF